MNIPGVAEAASIRFKQVVLRKYVIVFSRRVPVKSDLVKHLDIFGIFLADRSIKQLEIIWRPPIARRVFAIMNNLSNSQSMLPSLLLGISILYLMKYAIVNLIIYIDSTSNRQAQQLIEFAESVQLLGVCHVVVEVYSILERYPSTS